MKMKCFPFSQCLRGCKKRPFRQKKNFQFYFLQKWGKKYLSLWDPVQIIPNPQTNSYNLAEDTLHRYQPPQTLWKSTSGQRRKAPLTLQSKKENCSPCCLTADSCCQACRYILARCPWPVASGFHMASQIHTLLLQKKEPVVERWSRAQIHPFHHCCPISLAD